MYSKWMLLIYACYRPMRLTVHTIIYWCMLHMLSIGWMIRTGDILHQPSLQPLAKLKVSFSFCWKSVSVFNFCWNSVAVFNFVAVVNYGGQSVANLDYFETTSSSASASAYVTVPAVSTTYTVEAAVLGVLMLTYDHDGNYNIIRISNNNDKGDHFRGRHQHHHQHNHQHNHFNAFAASPSTDSSGPSIDRVSSFITRS